jgi:ribosomal protein S18 acetylase RimI-like enzyme
VLNAIFVKAKDADLAEVNQLVNSAYRGDSSRLGWTTEADLLDGIRTDEQQLHRMIHQLGSFILLYKEENKILASVHLRREKHKLYLGMLTVSPPLQNRGIGKKMLRAAEDHAKRLGCHTIYMSVITSRTELIEWYNRHGYYANGERRPFPMHDPKFGLPKTTLEFLVLEKWVGED